MDEELVKEFLVESHENLDQLDQDLVSLEGDPTNPEMLSRIFRTIHTVKGTCGFLGFTKLEWVTHVGENLLGRLRDGELQLNAEITTALLSLVDAVREILQNIEATQRELEKVFKQHGIERIAAMGLPLDPNQHQAMIEIPNAEHEPGTIVQEMQSGWMIKDRLLRPAMVGVAKKPD